MGFRLIKESSEEYKQKMTLLKKQQLEAEMERWRHLTIHSPEESRSFLDHFEQVRHRVSEADSQQAHASELGKIIKDKNINIATVQGNMEISRLKKLLEDVSDELIL